MKFCILVLITLLSSQFAFADGVANPFSSNGDVALAAKGSNTILTPDMAQWLYGAGRIPRIEDTDRYYASGHTSNACLSSWSKMRKSTINPVGVQVPLETIEANAKEKGLSLSKVHRALGVYLQNQTKIPDQQYISIVDFDKSGAQNRCFFINLKTGKITAEKVSAGMASDPDHNFIADRFSNRGGSNASSTGCAIATGHYPGAHGDSIKVHGLEPSNNNSCSRLIAVHATYSYAAGTGRSDGCLAVEPKARNSIYDMLGKGGLVCSYRDGKAEEGKATHRHHSKRFRHHYYQRSVSHHYRHHYRRWHYAQASYYY